jgi:hypothetical protein
MEIGASSNSNRPSSCDVGFSVAFCSLTTHYNSRWSVNIASIISNSDCTGLVVTGNGVGSGGDGNGVGGSFASADLMPAITLVTGNPVACR